LTYKPSKVLIIGNGPIIIGQAPCHSSESWNPGIGKRGMDSGLRQNDNLLNKGVTS
jgi:hypothetical protein